MNYHGIDTAGTLTTSNVLKAKAEGFSFVGRYLSRTSGSTAWKVIHADEALRIRSAGLAILLIWEVTGNRARSGAAEGSTDGAMARVLAQSMGVPDTAVIYFAVDYDAPKEDYSAIAAYLKAARASVAPYSAGVYGSRRVCDAMYDCGAVRYFMQCCAWSIGMTEHADVYQYAWQDSAEAKAAAAKIGIDVDLCRAVDLRASGMWMPEQKEYDDGDGGVIVEYPTDTPKVPWYAENMAWAKENGLINDGRPTDNLTRAEMATILRRFDDRVQKMIREEILRHLPEDDSGGGLLADD